MLRYLATIALLSAPHPTLGASYVAARHIPAKTVITQDDLILAEDVEGGTSDIQQILGLETPRAIYKTRIIDPETLQPPALIERNQVTTISYKLGGMEISTEARALDRGAAGDVVRAMNLSSKTIISAIVLPNGTLSADISPVSQSE